MDDDVRVINWATYDQTALAPLTLCLAVLASILIFALPRRLAVLPLVALATLVPYPQRVVLAGVGFDIVRVGLLCGVVRVFARGETHGLQFAPLDKAFFAWAAIMFLVPALTVPGHVVQSIGFLLDNMMEYLVLRCLITDEGCLKPLARLCVLLSVVVCLGMLIERKFQVNFFYLLGAPREVTIREGAVRATAGFDHPILAGTYGAVILPLVFLLRNGDKRDRSLWLLGMAMGFLIVAASKSSGPLYSLVSGVIAIALWPLRRRMRLLRNLIWAILLVLQLIMVAPVWSLLFRIPEMFGLVAGSTSFHRYELITLAVKHLDQWWLAGITIDQVARWEWGINDITNQFLYVGFSCGLLGMILFIWILVRGFSMVGRRVRQDGEGRWPSNAWLLGSLLYVHVMSFFGVSYFSGFWFFLNLSFVLVSACCGSPVASAAGANAAAAEFEEPKVEYEPAGTVAGEPGVLRTAVGHE